MDRITLAPFILGLLKRIQNQRAILTVTLPGSDKNYNSAILEINEEQAYLAIDELSPESGHPLLLDIKELRARTRVEGARTSFSTTLIDAGRESGIAYYNLALPTEIDYLQQRASYRVKTGVAQPIPVTLIHAEDQTIKGELQDLSIGGLSIRVAHKQLPVTLKTTDTLPCCFRLTQDEEIRCMLEIRSIRHKDNSTPVRLGCRFINMSTPQQKIIQRHIIALEREQIKKMPKGG